jgi:hypothetical protein
MANWCNNSIIFYQEDGGNAMAEAFYTDIKKYQNYKDYETGEVSDWVGHWLQSNQIDTGIVYSRGFFTNCELEGNYVRIDMETAYTPLPEIWDLMAGKYELSYVYLSEEPGCEIYVNTDDEGRFFPMRYTADCYDIPVETLDSDFLEKCRQWIEDYQGEILYFNSWEEVLKTFEVFDFHAADLEDLNSKLEVLNIRVHEYSSE